MTLIRELLLGIGVIFLGSWAVSTGFMLMSLPNDLGVISGSLTILLTLVGMGASARRHSLMLWNYLRERNHNA